MTKENLVPTPSSETSETSSKNGVQRRSFLKGLGVAGAALSAGALLSATV